MGKKKILYVITKSTWGGAQRYVFDLATNLPKDRFHVSVAAGGNGPLIQKLENAGIQTTIIPHLERDINPLKELFSLYFLFRIFKKERPDVVHLNSSKIGGLGAIAAYLAGVPKIVFTVHGWAFHENRPKWQRELITFFSKVAARFQHHIIHVSKKDLSTTLQCRIAPAEKSTYIPLGIADAAYLSRNDARSSLSRIMNQPITGDAVVLGTIAELTKNKGLTYLIDAIHLINTRTPKRFFPNFKTVIIGEGEERSALEAKIHQFKLETVVHLAGFIPNAAQYLRAFDCFVLPSLKEGLPYTLLEAKEAGIPVIATDVGGTPEALENHTAILVAPLNSEKIFSALIFLYQKNNTIKPENRLKAVKGKPSLGLTAFNEMLAKTIAIYQS